jgi:hypothetical protein
MTVLGCQAKDIPTTQTSETDIDKANPKLDASKPLGTTSAKQLELEQATPINPNVAIYNTRKATVEDFPRICGAAFENKLLSQGNENQTDIHDLIEEAGYVDNEKKVGDFDVRINIKKNIPISRFRRNPLDGKRELVTSPYVGWSCSLKVTSLQYDDLKSKISGHVYNAEKALNQVIKKSCTLQGALYALSIYETHQTGSSVTLTIGVEYSSQDFLNCQNGSFVSQLYDEYHGVTEVSGKRRGIGGVSGMVYLYNGRINPSLIENMSDGFSIMIREFDLAVTDSKLNIIGRLDPSGYIIDEQERIIGRYDPLAHKPR